MKLTIKERLQLAMILPKQASVLEMILVKELGRKIVLTSLEIEEFEIKETEKGIVWKGDKELELSLTSSEINILKECVKKLDDEKLVNLDNLDLCVKINNL